MPRSNRHFSERAFTFTNPRLCVSSVILAQSAVNVKYRYKKFFIEISQTGFHRSLPHPLLFERIFWHNPKPGAQRTAQNTRPVMPPPPRYISIKCRQSIPPAQRRSAPPHRFKHDAPSFAARTCVRARRLRPRRPAGRKSACRKKRKPLSRPSHFIGFPP